MPIVIEIAGSSTVISGSGRGSSGSARVSPIVISGMPAMAMMSPGPAVSAGTRSSASVIEQLGDLDPLDGAVGRGTRRPAGPCGSRRCRPGTARAGRGRARRRGWSRAPAAARPRRTPAPGCGQDRRRTAAPGRSPSGMLAVGRAGQRGPAGPGRGVDDRELDLVLVGVEVEEQLVGLVDDLGDAGVGPVHLVDDQDDRQLGLAAPCAARTGSAAAGPRRRRPAARRRRPWTGRAPPRRRSRRGRGCR